MEKMEMLFNYLQAHRMLALVAFVIIFDLFLGVMRSIIEINTYSSSGFYGLIRILWMIACLLFLVVLDFLIHLDLIAWLPSQILDIFKAIGITTIGISDVFALLFIVFELLSILKNWALIGLPMFKGVNEKVTRFLETFTDEMPSINKNE